MIHKVKFINLEEDDKDLIVSFAVDDPPMGVKSLILSNLRLRTPGVSPGVKASEGWEGFAELCC